MTQSQTGSDVALGPIGNRIIFENDHVRVWDLVVEAGRDKGMHRHDLPYVIVPMTAGDIEIIAVDGRSYKPKDVVGEAIWREAGEVHNLYNRGNDTYRNVLIEIKTAAKS